MVTAGGTDWSGNARSIIDDDIVIEFPGSFNTTFVFWDGKASTYRLVVSHGQSGNLYVLLRSSSVGHHPGASILAILRRRRLLRSVYTLNSANGFRAVCGKAAQTSLRLGPASAQRT